MVSISPLPTGAETPISASPQPSPTLSTDAEGLPSSAPTQTSSLPTLASNDGSVKVSQFCPQPLSVRFSQHGAQVTDLPPEVVSMISEEIVSYADFLSFSGCMLYIHNSTRWAFGKRIRAMTIYPCEDQMRHILEALQDPEVAKFVRKLTLLAEDLREHEYGYVQGWEVPPGMDESGLESQRHPRHQQDQRRPCQRP